jgi:hypothetical protein
MSNANEEKTKDITIRIIIEEEENPYEDLGILGDILWEWDQYYEEKKKRKKNKKGSMK